MTKYLFLLSLSIFAVIAPCTVQAQAEAPKLLPVQGYLTDAAGKPLDGNVKIRFRLYDTSEPNPANTENVVHEETRTIDVTAGHFTVYLGDDTEQPLSLDIFAQHSVLFVGIKVSNDAQELAPLLQLATAPYAGFAQSCGDAASVGGKAAEDVLTREQADARYSLSRCYWINHAEADPHPRGSCSTSGTRKDCRITCAPGDYVITGGCDADGTSRVYQSTPFPSAGYTATNQHGPFYHGAPAGPTNQIYDGWKCGIEGVLDAVSAFCCPGS
jgi:hypothetical protein